MSSDASRSTPLNPDGAPPEQLNHIQLIARKNTAPKRENNRRY
jgi:hypothetical protein